MQGVTFRENFNLIEPSVINDILGRVIRKQSDKFKYIKYIQERFEEELKIMISVDIEYENFTQIDILIKSENINKKRTYPGNIPVLMILVQLVQDEVTYAKHKMVKKNGMTMIKFINDYLEKFSVVLIHFIERFLLEYKEMIINSV